MNYIDLFSGIGGFHQGLLQAGFNFKWTGYSEIDRYAKKIYHKHFPESKDLGDVKNIQIESVEQIPRRPSLQSTGDKSFPIGTIGEQVGGECADTEQANTDGITTTIRTATRTFHVDGRIHIITFGFPCQDISVAGKRGGLTASRSGLFFEAMRIIGDAKPDLFIFENVKGLFSSNEGRDFEIILRTVADLGLYDCEWQLVNTRWVLPQNRERVYFIGHLRGRSTPKVFPIGEGFGKYVGKSEDISSAIDANYHKGKSKGFGGQGRQMIQLNDPKHSYHRVYSPDGIGRTLKGECGGKTGFYDVSPMRWQRTEKGKEARKQSKERGKDYTPFSNGHRELVESDDSACGCVTNALNKDALIGIGWSKSTRNWGTENRIKEGEFNSLSCGEGCSNQSTSNFVIEVANTVTPDAYLARGERDRDEHGKSIPTSMHTRRIRRLTPVECERLQGFPDGFTECVSDTQRYRCLGNAVSVPIVEMIGKGLLDANR